MISLADREALLAARNLPLPTDLQAFLTEIVAHAAEVELLDLTYVVIVDRGDTEKGIAAELGFSPLTNPIDGIRWDQPGFIPYWAHLRLRGGWYELIHTVSDDGFAFILLIQSADDSEPARMCAHFTTVPL